MNSKVLICFASLLMLFSSQLLFADFSFVGVGKCKACHKKKKKGEQYKIWSNSAHAKAFESLASPKSKELAATVGVSGEPQTSKECLVCHTSPKYDASGKERPAKMFGKKFKMEEGVQCESCHGPGEKYRKKKVKKKIAKEGGAAKSKTAKEAGLLFPDEQSCRHCHAPQIEIGGITYKNPTFKDFNFSERMAEIAHPIPK